jgi:hypothetical protein
MTGFSLEITKNKKEIFSILGARVIKKDGVFLEKHWLNEFFLKK